MGDGKAGESFRKRRVGKKNGVEPGPSGSAGAGIARVLQGYFFFASAWIRPATTESCRPLSARVP